MFKGKSQQNGLTFCYPLAKYPFYYYILRRFVMKLRAVAIIIFLSFFITEITFGHSGGLDANGGHWDHQKKEYHYHRDGKIVVDKSKVYEEREDKGAAEKEKKIEKKEKKEKKGKKKEKEEISGDNQDKDQKDTKEKKKKVKKDTDKKGKKEGKEDKEKKTKKEKKEDKPKKEKKEKKEDKPKKDKKKKESKKKKSKKEE
jgi:hypothetical protein